MIGSLIFDRFFTVALTLLVLGLAGYPLSAWVIGACIGIGFVGVMVSNAQAADEIQGIRETLFASLDAKQLSDRDLVLACRKSDLQDEILIEEMMSRLYPGMG